ncbi:hypothetical protein [Nonomuraea sp. 10N515B]
MSVNVLRTDGAWWVGRDGLAYAVDTAVAGATRGGSSWAAT